LRRCGTALADNTGEYAYNCGIIKNPDTCRRSKKMKRSIFVSLTVLTVIALSVPAAAIPRLQTYIVDSQYSINNTWVSNSSNFDLKVVGYWAEAGNNTGTRPMCQTPSYDYMDCYLAMSVPTDQMGQIFINGVEISAFENWANSIPTGTNLSPTNTLNGVSVNSQYSFLDLGRIDNNQINAPYYGFGRVFSPGWGDELTLNVVVRGFEWANFDALGVDSQGNTFMSSQFHNSSYYATPEPSTLSLLGLGLLGIAPLLRRKKR